MHTFVIEVYYVTTVTPLILGISLLAKFFLECCQVLMLVVFQKHYHFMLCNSLLQMFQSVLFQCLKSKPFTDLIRILTYS